MKKTAAQILAEANARKASLEAPAPAPEVSTEAELPTPSPAEEPTLSESESPFEVEDDQVVISQALVDAAGDAPIVLRVESREGKNYVVGMEVGAPAAEPGPGISELATQLGAASVKLASAEAQVIELETALAGCVEIVSGSLDTMNIAMGAGKLDVSNMTFETLLATHATVKAQYVSKFPVGGVAALNPDDTKSKEVKVAADDTHLRRIAAVAGHRPIQGA